MIPVAAARRRRSACRPAVPATLPPGPSCRCAEAPAPRRARPGLPRGCVRTRWPRSRWSPRAAPDPSTAAGTPHTSSGRRSAGSRAPVRREPAPGWWTAPGPDFGVAEPVRLPGPRDRPRPRTIASPSAAARPAPAASRPRTRDPTRGRSGSLTSTGPLLNTGRSWRYPAVHRCRRVRRGDRTGTGADDCRLPSLECPPHLP